MKESEMLNAWLWEKHKSDIQWRRIRLGVLPTKEMARMYMTLLRWADAIVISKGVLYIIEAKLRPMPGAIGQLELYQQLLKVTPEFSQYKNFPVKLVLLTSVIDLAMVEMCTNKGIAFEVFSEEDVNIVRKKMMLPVV